MKTEPNEPIMFCDALIEDGTEILPYINEPINKYKQHQFWGLTKRELFAAMAMQGLLSGHYTYFKGNVDACIPDEIAKEAVIISDALITELNKEK